MNLRQSQRMQAKIKLAIEGCSGSGKTYSSLLLASGITSWNKIAIIDSENGSADLYAHLGNYNVLTLQTPFTPEKYIQAIEVCEKAGMEVIIIDSISHCWEYLLEYHSGLQGNSFTNWGKITPRQNSFIQKVLSSNSHIICTMRTKQDYVLTEKNGKMIPEKVGLKAVMRDGVDYEFTIVFDIDIKHNAVANKDRTGMFVGKPEFLISSDIGKRILQWCNSGADINTVILALKNAQTEEELYSIYHQYPEWREQLTPALMNRKLTLQSQEKQSIISNPSNILNYGNNAAITS
ncbi:AAA domain-containing protein [Dysgonomonas alginatilytica]|uniref:AAA domain-containing protein n=1 Tax=Dysgonomonas alginatilytica TaxID=1605892 RepID=A0A2V3PTX4_9BACT|nr:AAA family ATPase [Dysgonomonas alginatilytica]PXV67350.1 AAA domain-containing protein [Dysgonomonas alginatilytica]